MVRQLVRHTTTVTQAARGFLGAGADDHQRPGVADGFEEVIDGVIVDGRGHPGRASLTANALDMVSRVIAEAQAEEDAQQNSEQGTKTFIQRNSVKRVRRKTHKAYGQFPDAQAKLMSRIMESRAARAWKSLQVISTLYVVFALLFQAAFLVGSFSASYAAFELFVDLMHVLDGLFSAMLGDRVILVLFELLSGCPLGYILFALAGDETAERMEDGRVPAALWWVWVLTRLCGVVRFRHVKVIERSLSSRAGTIVVRLMRLAAQFMMLAHLIACGLFIVARSEHFSEDSWVVRKNLFDIELWPQYIFSLTYSISLCSTMGYGDFLTKESTESEVTFVAVVTVIAGLNFTFIMGTVLDLVAQLNSAEAEHFRYSNDIRLFLETKDVPKDLSRRIMAHLDIQWERTHGLEEKKLMNKLSLPLRSELKLHLCKDLLLSVPFFKGLDALFLMDLVGVLTSELLAPGDVLFSEGDASNSMFFLVHGTIEIFHYSQEDEHINDTAPLTKMVVGFFSDGSYFGEAALLEEPGLRNTTARAITYCDVFCLNAEDFRTIIAKHPDQHERMVELAREKMDEDGSEALRRELNPAPESTGGDRRFSGFGELKPATKNRILCPEDYLRYSIPGTNFESAMSGNSNESRWVSPTSKSFGSFDPGAEDGISPAAAVASLRTTTSFTNDGATGAPLMSVPASTGADGNHFFMPQQQRASGRTSPALPRPGSALDAANATADDPPAWAQRLVDEVAKLSARVAELDQRQHQTPQHMQHHMQHTQHMSRASEVSDAPTAASPTSPTATAGAGTVPPIFHSTPDVRATTAPAADGEQARPPADFAPVPALALDSRRRMRRRSLVRASVYQGGMVLEAPAVDNPRCRPQRLIV